MVLLTLPVFLALMGLVVDGAHAFGEKRRTQNAADAAALAAVQNLIGSLSSTCPSGPPPINDDRKAAECYSEINGGPSTLKTSCTDRDLNGFPIPGAPKDTNCYTNPYKGNPNLVEVRITRSVDEFFLDVIGLGGLLDEVSGRAVAGVTPLMAPDTTNTTTIPGTTVTGTTFTNTGPGSTDVLTITTPADPGGAQAFVMSTHCSAIQYAGNPKGATLSSLATNGGLTFGSLGNKKIVQRLGFNEAGCPRPPGEPTGAACENPSNPTGCVVERVPLTPPQPWPVPPPPLPTPLPVGTVWDPSVHYGVNCILLAPAGSSFTLTAPPPPGVYCVSGPTALLLINNSTTAGDGMTFYALNGARIEVASNTTSVKFYWPSSCGARPDPLAPGFTRTGYTCFGRAIDDPLVVLYSTNSTPQSFTSPSCSTSAICIHGADGSLDGDVFAPLPNTFPPPANQGGGTVYMAGGGASAGVGFVEAWQLVIEGNSGQYKGSGPVGGGGTTTITNTTPGPETTITITGTTDPGTIYTTTTPGATTGSTNPALDE